MVIKDKAVSFQLSNNRNLECLAFTARSESALENQYRKSKEREPCDLWREYNSKKKSKGQAAQEIAREQPSKASQDTKSAVNVVLLKYKLWQIT